MDIDIVPDSILSPDQLTDLGLISWEAFQQEH